MARSGLSVVACLVLLVSSGPGGGGASLQCPARCTCDSEGLIDCSGLQLTEMPTFLFPQTGVYRFLLDNNDISELRTDDFDKLVSLRELSVADNRISGVDCRVFDKAPITDLILDNNLIEDITDITNIGHLAHTLERLSLNKNRLKTANLLLMTPDTAESLGQLHLSGNDIVGVNYKSTTEMPKLTQLDLGHNRLSDLHANMPQIAPKLEKLYLNNNKIRLVADEVLEGSSELSSVDLRDNAPLTCSFLDAMPDGVDLYYDYCSYAHNDTVYYPPGVPTPPATEPPFLCTDKPGYFPQLVDTFLQADLNKFYWDVWSEAECRGLCDGHSEAEVCAGYTHLPQEGQDGQGDLCYIWKAGGIQETFSHHYVSRIRGLFNKYWAQEVKYFGSQLSVTYHERGSYEVCEEECLRDVRCTGYDWHLHGDCYTYTGSITLHQKKGDWNSAIRYT